MTKTYHSDILNEDYIILNSGGLKFKSGIIYTANELSMIKDLTDEEKIKAHFIKCFFNGVIDAA